MADSKLLRSVRRAHTNTNRAEPGTGNLDPGNLRGRLSEANPASAILLRSRLALRAPLRKAGVVAAFLEAQRLGVHSSVTVFVQSHNDFLPWDLSRRAMSEVHRLQLALALQPVAVLTCEVFAMSQLFAVCPDGKDRSGSRRLTTVSSTSFGTGSNRAAAAFDAVSRLDVSTELLHTISGVLDIRRVFTRVSQIVTQILPHDCLELLFLDSSNDATLEARSIDAFPAFRSLSMADDANFHVIGDLRREGPLYAHCDPPDLVERIVDAGYRSLIEVRRIAGEQTIGLVFYSKRPDRYTPDDVAIAGQIADYVGLAVSHEQLAEELHQGIEPRVRSETRVRPMAAGLGRRPVTTPMIGKSAEWCAIVKQATYVAPTEATVLIQGESGTGKEVVARFIHNHSARSMGPFVAINCAALPEHLIESELFGYERGAFTGAQQAKAGQIELAFAGVLFLDEVSELPWLAQAKLLRVLQEREFLRLGGTRLRQADVRVVAATNRDLREAVEAGEFREDLYYRLHVFEIRLPPLRDRRIDVRLFVDAFLQDISRSLVVPRLRVTSDAMQMLASHGWPGNVRELRNVLERAAILAEEGLITPEQLSLSDTPSTSRSVPTDLHAAERRTIERVLRETDWNKAKAARRLGLTRTQLYVRLRRYALEAPVAS